MHSSSLFTNPERGERASSDLYWQARCSAKLLSDRSCPVGLACQWGEKCVLARPNAFQKASNVALQQRPSLGSGRLWARQICKTFVTWDLCIPTAIYPFPGGFSMAYPFISGQAANLMCELGWRSLGVLELTALPSIKEDYWSCCPGG